MNIRDYIKKNFQDSNLKDLELSINSSIAEASEITLPGLGVLFEIIWKKSNVEEKQNILEKLIEGIKKQEN